MTRHTIEVCEIEFQDGGNTIWVHSKEGATVLRIKATGKVKAHRGCSNIVSHSDMIVTGDIEVCLVPKRKKK